jgi:predicted transcriptional regulator
MEGLRLLLLSRLRDKGTSSVDDLADGLKLRWTDAYHELERMLADRLIYQVDDNSDVYTITELGLRTLDVLDSVRAGPPGWRQGELW